MIQDVRNYSIAQLLDSNVKAVYRIPRYQRAYRWGKRNWEELFDDILDNDPGYFLGSIICINQSTDSLGVQYLEVIDGQQRMTTISLLLAAIYYDLWYREDELDDDQKLDLLNLKRRLVLKGHDDQPRILPQVEGSNRDDYFAVLSEIEVVSEVEPPPHCGLRKIFRALRYFGDRIEQLVADQDDPLALVAELLAKVEQATMVKIEVATHSDAYILFESLNNRGTPLTGIDLIKNKLLAKLETIDSGKIEHHYTRWRKLIEMLGDDYAIQERFFRHYYNAFRDELKAVVQVPLATRANLIQVYEKLINADPQGFLDKLKAAGQQYHVLLSDQGGSESRLGQATRSLDRIQGAPAYLLVLHLLVRKAALGLDDDHIARTVELLVKFFVRRNLTDVPPTRDLTRLFMSILDGIAEQGLQGDQLVDFVAEQLRAASASDAVFREKLEGLIYVENVNATRFVLCALAEQSMTRENWVDLWQLRGRQYVWTIEHVFPQGEKIPKHWVNMIADGDAKLAADLQDTHVHKLGNLTISGFNSALGTKTFLDKRDRKDSKGRPVGYRNGLKLNADLAEAESWSIEQIDARTKKLADEAMQLFSLGESA